MSTTATAKETLLNRARARNNALTPHLARLYEDEARGVLTDYEKGGIAELEAEAEFLQDVISLCRRVEEAAKVLA